MDHYYHHHRHPPQVDGLSNNHTTLDQSNRTRGVKYKHLTGFQLNRHAQNTRASIRNRDNHNDDDEENNRTPFDE